MPALRWTKLTLIVALVGAVGCGARVEVSADGAGGSAGSGGSASSNGTGALGPGWTECASPDGFRICGGPADCTNEMDVCPACMAEQFGFESASTCITDALAEHGGGPCYLCSDGNICVQHIAEHADVFSCAPYNLGVLYAKAGLSQRVRYADYGAFNAEPLPVPASCPDADGVTICGGNCGGCGASEVCTGRSPLHPYGMCLADLVPSCALPEQQCDSGYACFVFDVEAAAQALADRNGYCLPIDQCQKTAANLPGGGSCVVP